MNLACFGIYSNTCIVKNNIPVHSTLCVSWKETMMSLICDRCYELSLTYVYIRMFPTVCN